MSSFYGSTDRGRGRGRGGGTGRAGGRVDTRALLRDSVSLEFSFSYLSLIISLHIKSLFSHQLRTANEAERIGDTTIDVMREQRDKLEGFV